MTLSKAAQRERAEQRDEAIQTLHDYGIRPGSTVYTVMTHRSRSGMRRSIKLVIPATVSNRHGEHAGVVDVSWAVARAVGWRFDRDNGGVIIDGAGMDMGFHAVYSLSRTLFPQGHDCIGEGCPSNDHNNRRPYSMDPADFPGGHRDGGYALKHEWL